MSCKISQRMLASFVVTELLKVHIKTNKFPWRKDLNICTLSKELGKIFTLFSNDKVHNK